jgi:hypothetical protein
LTNNSAGAALRMIAGRTQGTGGALSRRALLRFNIGSIPSGSTINSASLDLTHDTPLADGSQSFGIHRITGPTNWVEGTAASGSVTVGTGAATAGGGATWNNRTTGTPWGTGGGDFIASSTATISVPQAAGTATSGSLASDVQLWVNGTNNFGWLLKGNEASASTVKRFLTRESGSPPTLNVNFTRPLP